MSSMSTRGSASTHWVNTVSRGLFLSSQKVETGYPMEPMRPRRNQTALWALSFCVFRSRSSRWGSAAGAWVLKSGLSICLWALDWLHYENSTFFSQQGTRTGRMSQGICIISSQDWPIRIWVSITTYFWKLGCRATEGPICESKTYDLRNFWILREIMRNKRKDVKLMYRSSLRFLLNSPPVLNSPTVIPGFY